MSGIPELKDIVTIFYQTNKFDNPHQLLEILCDHLNIQPKDLPTELADFITPNRELKDLEEDPSLPDTYFLDH